MGEDVNQADAVTAESADSFVGELPQFVAGEVDYNSSHQPLPELGAEVAPNPPNPPNTPHRQHTGNQVLINVYEVAGFGHVNRLMASSEAPIGGALHAGVEVYGREWSYGGGLACGSGVACERPRQNRQHKFRETVVMPATDLSYSEVAEVVGELLDLWPAGQYHWLRKNCLTFANELCERLGVGRMPAWIDRFARGAGAVDQGVSMVSETAEGVVNGARLVMGMLYGAGVCGQCCKMPPAKTLSLHVVEQLSSVAFGRKVPVRPLVRKLSPESKFGSGAFAPRLQAPDTDGTLVLASPHLSSSSTSTMDPGPDLESSRWEPTAEVPSEAPAPRPAMAVRARPEAGKLGRRQVPPVPMLGVMPVAVPFSPRERSYSQHGQDSPCSMPPSPQQFFLEPQYLDGRAAAPPSLRRDGPDASACCSRERSPPPAPRVSPAR